MSTVERMFDTSSVHRRTAPRNARRLKPMDYEQDEVAEIRAWFDERGWGLDIARRNGYVLAAYRRKGQSPGAGGIGSGNSQLEAAESALGRFESTQAI
jgi:hypothetical protein